jgi:hypothetical protein
MKRKLEARIIAWVSEPENQAKLLIYGSWVVLAMVLGGYLIMAYFIFVK